MDIIIPHSIRKKEMGGKVTDEAKKLFEKIKAKPDLADIISAKDLPAGAVLYKVYATTENGARRLLFLFQRVTPTSGSPNVDRWVLLLYRDKGDSIGKNMSHKNPEFSATLLKRLSSALADIKNSTPQERFYEVF